MPRHPKNGVSFFVPLCVAYSMKRLSDMEIGETRRILQTAGAGRKRLLDLGLTPGTAVTLYKRAPGGDPLEVALRGYHLSIRKADAEGIEVDA